MIYYLDKGIADWPARERFCSRMGISVGDTSEGRKKNGLIRAVVSSMITKPWHIFRLFPAFVEYHECKLHVRLLRLEAEKVRTDQNSVLVEHIVQQTCRHMVRESPKDWSELCGLASQKLAHIQYHDELKKSIFSKRDSPVT